MHLRRIPWMAGALTVGLVAMAGGCRDNQPKPPETEQTSGDDNR